MGGFGVILGIWIAIKVAYLSFKINHSDAVDSELVI